MSAFAAWIGASAPKVEIDEPVEVFVPVRALAQEPAGEPLNTGLLPAVLPVLEAVEQAERGVLTGSYSWLKKSRTWGCKVTGDHTPVTGEHVELRTRAGKLKGEQVGRVLWTDGRDSLCSLIPRY